MADLTKRFRVTGRVKGVGYCAWAREEAQALGLNGWAMDWHDGSVAGLIVGPEDSVSKFLSELDDGPPAAAVADVQVEDGDSAEAEDAGSGFHIRM